MVAAPAYLDVYGAPEMPEALLEHNCLTYAYASEGRVARFTGARRPGRGGGDARAAGGQ